jgi:methanogenic corrinoid protein MtbC1
MITTSATTTTTEEKVYNLTKELDEMKQRKKAFCKAYNEEIRRIQLEIKDLIAPEEKVELP